MKQPFALLGVTLTLLLATTLTTGCRTVNAGASDYRPMRADSTGSEKSEARYLAGNEQDSALIHPDDSIYISLLHTYVRDFNEANRIRTNIGMDQSRKEGELAIVARVHEVGVGTDFDFSTSGHKSGRVIFYCDGVRMNSHLNFSNISVYGPITYTRKPLAVSFYMIEVDSEYNDALGGLLEVVSSAGQKAYPPSSPALQVLEMVGGSLLQRDTDDVELAYHFILDPANPVAGNPRYAQLRAGNYILIKRESDDSAVMNGDTFDWSGVELDAQSGILYHHLNGQRGAVFTEATYLVFQIKKGFDPTDLDSAERAERFSTFMQRQSDAIQGMFTPSASEFAKRINHELAYMTARKSVRLLAGLTGRSEQSALEDRQRLLEEMKLMLAAESNLSAEDKGRLRLNLARILEPGRVTPMTDAEIDALLTEQSEPKE